MTATGTVPIVHSTATQQSTATLITESSTGRIVEIAAPVGAALVDLCDAHDAPIPFGCRVASCGTCRIDVLAGAEQLSPPAEDELDLLDVFNAAPAVRLACQARLGPGAVRIHVKAIQDE
jgi:2Fe-2S ferredoxin